jgi:predicted ATPase
MLMRRWERARQGDGQLVLIVGEPGLGKSRLIEEFHTRLRDVPHTWVEWSCSQLLQNTPLHPITEWGRMRFGSAEVPAEQRLAELESSLAQVQARSNRQRGAARPAGRYSAASGACACFGARGTTASAVGGVDKLGDRRSTDAANCASA